MGRRQCFALLLGAGVAVAAARPAAPTPAPWQLRLEAGRRAPSAITVVNRCAAEHRFELEKGPGLEWLATPEPATTVAAAGSVAVPVEVDASLLAAGLYGGRLSVRCTDCAAEPLCTQDRDEIETRLAVAWTPAELSRLRAEELMAGELLLLLDEDTPVAELARIEARHDLRRLRRFALPSLRLSVAAVVGRDPRRGLEALIPDLQQEPVLVWVQPSFRFETSEAGGGDPFAPLQHALRLVGAAELGDYPSGRGVRVAVVDTAVDRRHPDLEGQVGESASFVGGGRDRGADAHGTAVAGIVAARAGNGIGIRGLAPGSEVLAIEACRRGASAGAAAVCTSEGLARGLDLAIERQARVVNLSLGGPRDPLLGRLVAEAGRRGAVVVAAAGNRGAGGEPCYPAAWPEVVAASAVDADRLLYPAASRGPYVDLVAPGVEVLSTAPEGRFLPATGTSMAAAHVSAAVALLLETRPDLSPLEVAELLTSTARDLGAPGRDDAYGAGLLDLKALLAAASASPPPARPPD